MSGWGKVEFDGDMSGHLRHVSVPIVGDVACKQSYMEHGWDLVHSNMLCAGYEEGGKDACQVKFTNSLCPDVY